MLKVDTGLVVVTVGTEKETETAIEKEVIGKETEAVTTENANETASVRGNGNVNGSASVTENETTGTETIVKKETTAQIKVRAKKEKQVKRRVKKTEAQLETRRRVQAPKKRVLARVMNEVVMREVAIVIVHLLKKRAN